MDNDVTNLPPPAQLRVALIGYGEVGGIFGRALAARGVAHVAAYDVLLPDAAASAAMRERAVRDGVAIVIESFLAARRYGVEREVLDSLAETFPGMDWERNGDYIFSRVIHHGQRRAEEMREAAATVREAGLSPLMASAIAERQQWVADLARSATFAGAGKDEPWRAQADRVPRDDKC